LRHNPPAGLSDQAAVKRFWREARAAAAVTHPNVCQIYEVEEAPEGIFLAMELLAGQPLDARLEQGPCSPVDAANIALQVLSALGAMHERGLVHRDVKPSNVFDGGDKRHDLRVGPERPSAVALPHVAVEIDGNHCPSSSVRCPRSHP
jgi:serine/threonine protein kinase